MPLVDVIWSEQCDATVRWQVQNILSFSFLRDLSRSGFSPSQIGKGFLVGREGWQKEQVDTSILDELLYLCVKRQLINTQLMP